MGLAVEVWETRTRSPDMNRWSTKYLAALPFLLACDDLSVDDAALADAGGTRAATPSDVLVVHFETRSGPAAAPIAARAVQAPPVTGPEAAPDATPAETGDAEPATEAPYQPPAGTRWLLHEGRLVLAQGEAVQASWLRDAAVIVRAPTQDDGYTMAAQKIDGGALPASLTRLPGLEVKVFDREREVCVARIGPADAFSANAALVHLPDAWAEEPLTLPQHEAKEVFEQGLVTLTAALEPLMGDCGAGLWAAPLDAPKPVLYREAAPSPKLRRQAIAAFRALPAWQAAQAEMLAFYEDGPERRALRKERWDTLYDNRPEVTRYVSDRGGRELVVVTGDSVDGCGSPGQRLVSVLEVGSEGKRVRFIELASMPYGVAPDGLIDLEADGLIELIGSRGGAGGVAIERWHEDGAPPSEDNGWVDEREEQVHGYEVPDLTHYGCPC